MMDKTFSDDIDLCKTILANLINILFMFFLLIIFAILSTQIRMLENDTNKLLGIIVSIFAMVKLVCWCIRPQFIYRDKKQNAGVSASKTAKCNIKKEYDNGN